MISVTVLTKNSERYLEEVLSALKGFDEVVVYDTGSTDGTLSIAHKFANVSIFRKPFIGFGPTHNLASETARHDWILSIDSDEIVTPQMAEEILNYHLNSAAVYSFPRHNYFNGKFIKWCGWYPDRRVRLYHRGMTRFSESQVHEEVIAEGMNHIPLKGPLKHYSYHSISDFLEKMQLYSDLFVKQNSGKKPSSLFKSIMRGLGAFLKSYIIKRGFLGGYEGFIISLYNGHTAYYKYLKLYEANLRSRRSP